MPADCKRLDDRGLFIRQAGCHMKFSGRQHKLRSQSAVAVHSEHLKIFAAIDCSPMAGKTLTTVDVWLYRATITNADMRYILTNMKHLNAEFVSRNSWIAKKGHLAEIPTDIRPADTDAMHLDESFSPAGMRRGSNFDSAHRTGFFKHDRTHANQLSFFVRGHSDSEPAEPSRTLAYGHSPSNRGSIRSAS